MGCFRRWHTLPDCECKRGVHVFGVVTHTVPPAATPPRSRPPVLVTCGMLQHTPPPTPAQLLRVTKYPQETNTHRCARTNNAAIPTSIHHYSPGPTTPSNRGRPKACGRDNSITTICEWLGSHNQRIHLNILPPSPTFTPPSTRTLTLAHPRSPARPRYHPPGPEVQLKAWTKSTHWPVVVPGDTGTQKSAGRLVGSADHTSSRYALPSTFPGSHPTTMNWAIHMSGDPTCVSVCGVADVVLTMFSWGC